MTTAPIAARSTNGSSSRPNEERPEAVSYDGAAASLQVVWSALRKNVRDVIENVSLADLAAGTLPPAIQALTEDPEAWSRR